MELNRLLRIARARWWLFAFAAGIGLVLAFVLTSYLNRNIDSQWEAVAPLAVLPDPGAESGALEEKTFAVYDTALLTAQELYILPDFDIDFADDAEGIINFIATGSTGVEASQKAEGMRALVVEAIALQASERTDQIDGQLTSIRDRLAEVEAEIEVWNSQRETPELIDSVDLELRNSQVAAVQTQLNALYIERVTGVDLVADPLRTAADVETEIVALEQAYTELRLDILDDTSGVGSEYNLIDREINLLVREYNGKLAEFGALVLSEASSDVQPLGGSEVTDVTSIPGSAATNGIAGLVGGLLIALGVVLAHDKYRQSVWVGSDFSTVPFLGEVVQRAGPLVAGQAWYELGGPAERKRAIQSVRVTVESVSEPGVALGFMGIAPSSDIHEFGADFAMSMVTSGSRVLLIDADFERPSGLFEYSGGGASLSEMLQFGLADEESYRSFIKRSITEPTEIVPGLSAIPVGRGLADPADALSGRRLQIVLEEFRRVFDITIFVAGSGIDATTLATLNRMNGVILTVRPGQASRGEVEDASRQLAAFGVPVLGGTLLTRAGSGPSEMATVADPVVEPPSPRRAPATGSDAQDLLVEALLRERSRSAVGVKPSNDDTGADEDDASEDGDDHESVDLDEALDEHSVGLVPSSGGVDNPGDLFTSSSEQTVDLALVRSLVPAAGADPDESVAALLSETIEQVLRGFSGASGAQRVDPGIAEVTKYGFVPMVRIKGHKTIGARVLDALNVKIESAERSQLITELVSYFGIQPGGRSNERVVTAINDWARAHYFTRHLVETDRDPHVWHIASMQDTFEGLVHVTRCTKERIDLFRSEILRRQIDALNKSLKAASKARRADQVKTIEGQIKDLRTFDIAWGWLFEGTTPNARLWYPWKGPEKQPQGWDPNFDEGVRANVAPLQRLGVLAKDVLTGEELLALSPPS